MPLQQSLQRKRIQRRILFYFNRNLHTILCRFINRDEISSSSWNSIGSDIEQRYEVRVSSKIREKSGLERVRGVGNGIRFFSPSFLSPFPPNFIDDRRGFIYFYARVKRIRFVATPILVNVTVDLPWKRILLPNGAGWGNGGTLKRDLGL